MLLLSKVLIKIDRDLIHSKSKVAIMSSQVVKSLLTAQRNSLPLLRAFGINNCVRKNEALRKITMNNEMKKCISTSSSFKMLHPIKQDDVLREKRAQSTAAAAIREDVSGEEKCPVNHDQEVSRV